MLALLDFPCRSFPTNQGTGPPGTLNPHGSSHPPPSPPSLHPSSSLSNTGLPVNFTSSHTSIACIHPASGVVSVTGSGHVTLSAHQVNAGIMLILMLILPTRVWNNIATPVLSRDAARSTATKVLRLPQVPVLYCMLAGVQLAMACWCLTQARFICRSVPSYCTLALAVIYSTITSL